MSNQQNDVYNEMKYEAEQERKYMRRYKDFTDFLNDKFYAEHPTTLDDEWPDLFEDWLSDQDSSDLVKWADEFANHQLNQCKSMKEDNPKKI